MCFKIPTENPFIKKIFLKVATFTISVSTDISDPAHDCTFPHYLQVCISPFPHPKTNSSRPTKGEGGNDSPSLLRTPRSMHTNDTDKLICVN